MPSRRMPEGRTARPVVTGRALVLGAVVVLLVVLLAAPVHRFLGSRSDVSQAGQRLVDDRAARKALLAQRAQWSDPGFIERQARIRLQFAMPGDTVYVVVDKGQANDLEQTSGVQDKAATGRAWNTRLWDTVTAAGK